MLRLKGPGPEQTTLPALQATSRARRPRGLKVLSGASPFEPLSIMRDLPRDAHGPACTVLRKFRSSPCGTGVDRGWPAGAARQRGLDILGRVVGKDELMAQVWPSVVVEEATLRVHIGGAASTICTTAARASATWSMLTGRGCFVAPGRGSEACRGSAAGVARPGLAAHDRPAVGRDETVRRAGREDRLRRFVSTHDSGRAAAKPRVSFSSTWACSSRRSCPSALGAGAAGAAGQPERRGRRSAGRRLSSCSKTLRARGRYHLQTDRMHRRQGAADIQCSQPAASRRR